MQNMENRQTKYRSNTCFLLAFLIMAVCVGIMVSPSPAQAAVKAKSVSISQTAYVLKTGKSVKLKATVTPSSAKAKVKWTSSKSKVASVNSNGKVTAKKAGTTKITATAKDGSGKKASLKVKVVKNLKKIKSIKIKNKTNLLAKGEKLSLSTKILPKKATLQTLKYTSSDESVATVSKKGVVTAKKTGKVKITAQAQDGSKKKAVVTINVTAVTLTGSDLYLQGADGQYTWNTYVGRTKTLSAKVENASDQTVQWSSSDNSVVTVSQNGVIYGKKEGVAKISATAKNSGKAKAVCTVTVGPAETKANYYLGSGNNPSTLCFKLNYRDTTSFRIENSADHTVKTVKNSDVVLGTAQIGNIAKTSADGAEAFYKLLLEMKQENSNLVMDMFANFGKVRSVEWNKTANTITYTTENGGSTRTVVCEVLQTSENIELWEPGNVYRPYSSKNVKFLMSSGSSEKYYVLSAIMPDGGFVYKVSKSDIVAEKTTKPYLQMIVKTDEEGDYLDLWVDAVCNSEISDTYASFVDFSKLTMYNIYSDAK